MACASVFVVRRRRRSPNFHPQDGTGCGPGVSVWIAPETDAAVIARELEAQTSLIKSNGPGQTKQEGAKTVCQSGALNAGRLKTKMGFLEVSGSFARARRSAASVTENGVVAAMRKRWRKISSRTCGS